jgi:hypothetical protein
MTNRIAIVVLGCVSPPYDRTIEAIRQTWGAQQVAGIDIYYLYGNPDDDEGRRVLARYVGGGAPVVEADAICHIRDVLIVGCADHVNQQPDCLLRKRLRAFAYLAADDSYDLIYTVCATSYVDQHALARYAATLVAPRLVAGAVGIAQSRAPFVSGASMILSVEIARELGSHRQEIIDGNVFGHYDDVTMGDWIASRLSRVPLATFLLDVGRRGPLTEAHIFVKASRKSIDYVMAPAQDHRPVAAAFHYHFHSQEAHHMVAFHQRHFARQGDSTM